MSPLVSAIVPFFNVGELLDECLASIAAQTYPTFECILVDDGSTDGSSAIAQRWVDTDRRFRLIRQENVGPGPSRNAALREMRGEFFMFVDGDDLLAPRAFEQLLTSLQQSGSDFAGAQVWRLPLTRPVEKSFAHVEPFATFRQRTSIREVPLLMRDRMVWNKMWRRSFWETGGYEFPDMLFEDFPVLLRAHYDARAIDTLPDPVYVWRERPKGESISVRGDALDNVRDRVHSAAMCLDIVDAEATAEVRELVHSHLVDVDLREVMGSMLSAPEQDRPAVEALAHQLAQRIDPARIALAAPDLQKAYRAARDDDMELLRSLARARHASASAQRSTLQRAKNAPKALVKRATKVAEQVTSPRPRTASLVEVDFGDELITHRIRIKLDERVKRRATVTAKIGEEEMKVITAITSEGLICDLEIEPLTMARHGGFNPITLAIEAGPMHFEGHVVAPSDLLGGFHRAGYRLQGLNRGGRYGIERKRDADLVTGLVLDGETLHVSVNRRQGELVVEQPWPTTQRTYPIVDGIATVALGELIASDPADNPVTNVASRRLSVTDGATVMPLLLAVDGVRAPIAGRDVEVRRADDASAFLVHRPA